MRRLQCLSASSPIRTFNRVCSTSTEILSSVPFGIKSYSDQNYRQVLCFRCRRLQCLSASSPIRTTSMRVLPQESLSGLQCLSASSPIRTGYVLSNNVSNLVFSAFRHQVLFGQKFVRTGSYCCACLQCLSASSPIRTARALHEAQYEVAGLQCLSASSPIRTNSVSEVEYALIKGSSVPFGIKSYSDYLHSR